MEHLATDSISPLALRLADVVRGYRAAQRLSLGELSRVTGLSKTSLMRLEAGDGNPSLETMWRVGRAMGLSVGQLLEPRDPLPARLLRAGDGPIVESSAGMRGRLLHTDTTHHRTEFFELTLPAQTSFVGEPHATGTRELVHCVSGTLLCGPTESPLELETGDCVTFDGSAPHVYATDESGGRALLLMSYPIDRPAGATSGA